MKKKVFSIFIIFALFLQIFTPVSASVTENTDFEFLPIVNDGFDYYPDGYEIPQYPVYDPGCTLSTAGIIPEAFDLRDSGSVTGVKNQGYSGNCWSFSACASLESNAIMQGLASADEIDFSEAHLVWFSKNPVSSDPEDNLCADGTNNTSPYKSGSNAPTVAVTLARRSGLANESDYPFYPMDLSKMGNYPESSRYDSGSGYVFKSLYNYTSMTEVKTAIMSTGAVMALYYHDDQYYNSANSCHYHPTERTTDEGQTNHGITIVGWNDSYPKENFNEANQPTADGAWLCKNSWCTSWGDGGYFWLSYEDKNLCEFYSFILTDESAYDYCYTYNGLAPAGNLSYSGKITVANRYTAKRNENINSVSFWIKQTGLTAEVKIYTGITDSNNPFNSDIAYTYTFTTDKLGLITFDLNNSIPLNKGESFMAAITLTAPSSSDKVVYPFERYENGYSANDGESYFLISNTLFDTYKSGNAGNAYINVQTSCRHSLTEQSVTASTCLECGSSVSVCGQCGKSFTETLPLADHQFGEWVRIFNPTAVNEGLSERVCTVCGFKESETEPMLSSNGHKEIYIDDLIEIIFERLSVIIEAFFRLHLLR